MSWQGIEKSNWTKLEADLSVRQKWNSALRETGQTPFGMYFNARTEEGDSQGGSVLNKEQDISKHMYVEAVRCSF